MASKRCVGRLKDLHHDEIADFFLVVCKCQRLLENYYRTTSSTVTVQDGEFAGQTVKVVFHNNTKVFNLIALKFLFSGCSTSIVTLCQGRKMILSIMIKFILNLIDTTTPAKTTKLHNSFNKTDVFDRPKSERSKPMNIENA